MPSHTPEYRAYRLLQWTILTAAACLIAVVLGVFTYAVSSSHSRCEDLQDVRGYILEATNRGIASLPTIDYYRTRPAEKAEALKNLERQRAVFVQPLHCSLF